MVAGGEKNNNNKKKSTNLIIRSRVNAPWVVVIWLSISQGKIKAVSRSQVVFGPLLPLRRPGGVIARNLRTPLFQGSSAFAPRGMRDEAELPSQMAIKILGGALIQRRESGWVSLPYRNNQAGHGAAAAAGIQASDLTDGGQGFLNTCWSDGRFFAHRRAKLMHTKRGGGAHNRHVWALIGHLVKYLKA